MDRSKVLTDDLYEITTYLNNIYSDGEIGNSLTRLHNLPSSEYLGLLLVKILLNFTTPIRWEQICLYGVDDCESDKSHTVKDLANFLKVCNIYADCHNLNDDCEATNRTIGAIYNNVVDLTSNLLANNEGMCIKALTVHSYRNKIIKRLVELNSDSVEFYYTPHSESVIQEEHHVPKDFVIDVVFPTISQEPPEPSKYVDSIIKDGETFRCVGSLSVPNTGISEKVLYVFTLLDDSPESWTIVDSV